MRRDPPWTAIRVLVTGLGALLAVGVCRLVIAAVLCRGLAAALADEPEEVKP